MKSILAALHLRKKPDNSGKSQKSDTGKKSQRAAVSTQPSSLSKVRPMSAPDTDLFLSRKEEQDIDELCRQAKQQSEKLGRQQSRQFTKLQKQVSKAEALSEALSKPLASSTIGLSDEELMAELEQLGLHGWYTVMPSRYQDSRLWLVESKH